MFIGPGGLLLEPADVLAGAVLRRQRRRARGDDVREVHRVLHRVLLLAAHEEVGAQRLVGGGIHPHPAHQVVDLEALQRLDDVHVLGGLRLVHAVQHHPRHAVGRGRRVAGRITELRLVALHEFPGDRRVGRVVEVGAHPHVLAHFRRELDELLHAGRPREDEGDLRREPEVEDLAGRRHRVQAEVHHRHRVRLVAGGLGDVVGELPLAERMAVGAHELDPVVLAHFLDVLLDRPAKGVVGHQQVPALGLGVGLHEVVDDGLGRRVGAGRPLERVAMAPRARDVLGAAREVVEDLLALGDLRHGQRHARRPGADDVLRALAVDGLLGPSRRRAGLGLVVAGDVLDRAARGLHAPLLERHLHAPVEDGADVGEGPGERPQPEHHDVLALGPEHPGHAEDGRARAHLQELPPAQRAHGVLPRVVAAGRDCSTAAWRGGVSCTTCDFEDGAGLLPYPSAARASDLFSQRLVTSPPGVDSDVDDRAMTAQKSYG